MDNRHEGGKRQAASGKATVCYAACNATINAMRYFLYPYHEYYDGHSTESTVRVATIDDEGKDCYIICT